MTTTRNLTFNDATLRVIERDGEPWITSTDLARALGYSRPDDVARIYRRNADEFSAAMTAVARLDQGAQRQSGVVPSSTGHSDTRIFSLRGAHLIAMFAKTPVAAAFRRWVLDILDGWSAARATLPPPAASTPAQKVARLVEGRDIVIPRELSDAMGLPVSREAWLWLTEIMSDLGYVNAWVRADACVIPALPARSIPSPTGNHC